MPSNDSESGFEEDPGSPVTQPEEQLAASEALASFVDLKFQGGRFEKEGFPVGGLAELEKLDAVIQAVAKSLWKRENPDRSRVPRRFTAGFDLRLVRVDLGSVVPILERVSSDVDDADEGVLFPVNTPDYFDLSVSTIEDAFAAIVAGLDLPELFPDEATAAMARFGSSLHEDEKVVFRSNSADPVFYTPADRKRFFSTVRNSLITQRTSRVGRVSALDADEQTFTFAPINAPKVDGLYQEPERFQDLYDVLRQASENRWVRLTGDFRLKPDSSIHSIADVEIVEVLELPATEWGTRLLELADLQEGWVEDGEVIAVPSIELARDLMTHLEDMGVRPGIFPDPEGGIQLEWNDNPFRNVVAIDPDLKIETRRSDRSTQNRDKQHLPDLDSLKFVVEGWITR